MAVTHKRDFSQLASKTYDVLVVGGGIIGLAVAYDAALRGLSVALVEKSDFGGATSQGCFKIVHGGLRYLQHLNFGRLLSSVREQRVLRQIAPHLVQPLPILVPCYGYGMKGRELLRLGNAFYEALAYDRNEGVDAACRLPQHRVLSNEQCLGVAPHLPKEGLRGGVVFFDGQMVSSERLSLAFAFSAISAGAVLCNYVEATGVDINEKEVPSRGIKSVSLRCVRSQKALSCSARMVVNATGPWVPLFSSLVDGRCQVRPGNLLTSQGIQVVLPQTVRGFTVAIESRERDDEALVARGTRNFFLMPWRGHTLLGTSDSRYAGDPSDYRFEQNAVREFMADTRKAYNHPHLSMEHVRYVFGGVRPVDESDFWTGSTLGDQGSVTVSKRNIIIDHAEAPPPGPGVNNLLSVSGVKYTTCRGVAEEVVDRICVKLGRSVRCKTAEGPLTGGGYSNLTEFTTERIHRWAGLIAEAVVRHLIAHYGSAVDDVVALAERAPELALPLGERLEVIGAEVVYGARYEMVETLADVLFRRTGLGTLGHPGKEALKKASELVARELGWSEEMRSEEVRRVEELLAVGLTQT